MLHRKLPVTLGIVVLMIVGALVSTVFSRRNAHQEQQRVRDAVARFYTKQTGTGSVDVRTCDVAPAPPGETNAANPRARYDCVVIVDSCRQTRRFAVPVSADGTPADAIAAPAGPSRARSCS